MLLRLFVCTLQLQKKAEEEAALLVAQAEAAAALMEQQALEEEQMMLGQVTVHSTHYAAFLSELVLVPG